MSYKENCIFFGAGFVIFFILFILTLVHFTSLIEDLQQNLCTEFYTETKDYKQCLQINIQTTVKLICLEHQNLTLVTQGL